MAAVATRMRTMVRSSKDDDNMVGKMCGWERGSGYAGVGLALNICDNWNRRLLSDSG